MLLFDAIKDPITGEEWLETALSGKQLLLTPLLNKGTSFTLEERCELGLLGKLPSKIETLNEQVKRDLPKMFDYHTMALWAPTLWHRKSC